MIRLVDSSVALKWYAPEPQSDVATALLGGNLIAPDLILAEVANALWRKVKLGEIVEDQAASALPHLRDYVDLVQSAPFAEEALQVALDLGHPVYDCLFLTVAQKIGAELVTADKRLVTRCRGTRFEQQVRLL